MLASQDFDAKGDGASDDTQALQAALDAARGSGLRLEARRYQITDTLIIHSGTALEGSGAVLAMQGADRPLLASAAWTGQGPAGGHTLINGLRLEASGQGAGQHGIVLFDYWSRISGVEVIGSGGRGIMLASASRNGTRPGGTLVENRILDCTVRNAGDAAFWLGGPANGALSDGTMRDCIASLGDGVTAPALFIGHAAGWTVDGLHSYGGRPGIACHIVQPYFTTLENLYIEGFGEAAIRLEKAQTSTAITNAHMLCEGAGKDRAYIAISAHGDYTRPLVHLANTTFWHDSSEAAEAVRIESGGIALSSANASIGGMHAGQVGRSGLDAAGNGATGRTTFTWQGRAAQRIALDRRADGKAFDASFIAAIAARAEDGGLVSSFSATITWSRIDARAAVALADIMPMGPASGFSEPPRLTLEREAGGITLYLEFTPAASGPGHLTLY